MNTKPLLRLFVCFLTFIAASCNKANYIPDLGSEWKNLASPVNDAFYFNVNEPSAYQSDFIGNESVNYSYVYHFSGSFENHKIHFTFSEGPNSGKTYSGTISGSGKLEEITLSTPSGQITLTR